MCQPSRMAPRYTQRWLYLHGWGSAGRPHLAPLGALDLTRPASLSCPPDCLAHCRYGASRVARRPPTFRFPVAPTRANVDRRPPACGHGEGGTYSMTPHETGTPGTPRATAPVLATSFIRDGCGLPTPVLATSFIRDGCGLPTPPFGSRGGARPTPGRPRCACRALRGQAAAAGSGSAARSPGAVAPR